MICHVTKLAARASDASFWVQLEYKLHIFMQDGPWGHNFAPTPSNFHSHLKTLVLTYGSFTGTLFFECTVKMAYRGLGLCSNLGLSKKPVFKFTPEWSLTYGSDGYTLFWLCTVKMPAMTFITIMWSNFWCNDQPFIRQRLHYRSLTRVNPNFLFNVPVKQWQNLHNY